MIHHDLFSPPLTFSVSMKKVLHPVQTFLCQRRRTAIVLRGTTLIFMDLNPYSHWIRTHHMPYILPWITVGFRLRLLFYCIPNRIWGSRSEGSSIHPFGCFAPSNSSLDPKTNVIILFIAFFFLTYDKINTFMPILSIPFLFSRQFPALRAQRNQGGS